MSSSNDNGVDLMDWAIALTLISLLLIGVAIAVIYKLKVHEVSIDTCIHQVSSDLNPVTFVNQQNNFEKIMPERCKYNTLYIYEEEK